MENKKEFFTFEAPRLDRLNGLQHILRAAILYRQLIVPVEGDCMEGAGIEDGGMVAVDCTRYPRPGRRDNGIFISGDPCICWARPPHSCQPAGLMCKQYIGVWMGHEVGTRYRQEDGKPFRMNGAYHAEIILGVVFASWGRDGRLIWMHDPSEYPEELPDRITIKGGNVVPESCMVVQRR